MITFRESDHTYWNGKIYVPSVSEILNLAYPFKAVISPEDLELARLFGNAVHKASQYADMDVLDPKSVDKAITPWLDDWSKFRADTGAQVMETEKLVYSNTYRVAGTLDRLLLIGGKIVLVDIKTGTKNSKRNLVQIAGYEILASEEMGIKIDRRIIVQLTGNGYKIHEPKKRENEEEIFRGLARQYWY